MRQSSRAALFLECWSQAELIQPGLTQSLLGQSASSHDGPRWKARKVLESVSEAVFACPNRQRKDASIFRPCRCSDQGAIYGLCSTSKKHNRNHRGVVLSNSINLSYLGDEVSRVRTDFDIVLSFLGPANWRVLNQIVHLIFVWIVKWRDSNDHLVNEDSESPPVQRLVVT